MKIDAKKHESQSFSPCKTCRLVNNAFACDNINCSRWQSWWKNEWERTRLLFRAAMDAPAPNNPFAFQYDTPEHVRRYMAEDPCEKCKIPKNFCGASCMSKKRWIEAKGEEE